MVDCFDLCMGSIFGLDLFANVGVTGDAKNILSSLQRLVAAAALIFECGVR